MEVGHIGYVQEASQVSKYIVKNGPQASRYPRRGLQVGKGYQSAPCGVGLELEIWV